MEKTSSSNIQLPPGFRFHPSDEELIMHYLINKAALRPVPANIIAEVELYKFNPWELPEKAVFGEEEWYFFTPRDRKYPNGRRPNRMAVSGYWKATGTDKPIFSSGGGKVIGLKKALVFYKGKPPKGSKTEWIMHEYRLPQNLWNSKKKWSMRLDDWVLCRVWRKTSMYDSRYDHTNEPQQCYSTGKPYFTDTTPKLKLTDEDHLFKDCPMLPFLCEDTKITAASSILQLKPEVDNNSPWYDLFNSLNKKQFEGNIEEGLTQKEEQVPFALGEDNTIGHISSNNIEQLQLQNFNANYWDPTNPYS